MDDEITLNQIRQAIADKQFRHANETELHNGIATVLTGLGLTAQHELSLDQHNRIDLVTELPRPGGSPVLLGIEVKIAGTPSDVRRQVQRYARFEQLGALLLVTTIYRHMVEVARYSIDAPAGNPAGARRLLNGMPFDLIHINRGML